MSSNVSCYFINKKEHIDMFIVFRDAWPKKLWNFESRAYIGLQKNLDFINKKRKISNRDHFSEIKILFLLY